MFTPKTTPSVRLLLAPALALAAIVPAASIAHAGEVREPIVVTSPEKMQAWTADANQSINRTLRVEPQRRPGNPSAGIVQLTFEMGDDGKPTNIKVRRSTANWTAVRTARVAVRKLGDISDVPVTNPQDARFLANIIFAGSQSQYRELAQELETSERARLASGTVEGDLIALGG